MESTSEKVYSYSFCIWPHEKWNFPHSVFEVFECLKGRIEFDWTEEHFEKVRSDLSHYGLVMHEIARRLFHEEEIVL